MDPIRLSTEAPYRDYLPNPTWPEAVRTCREELEWLAEQTDEAARATMATRYLRWLTDQVEALIDDLGDRGLPIDSPAEVTGAVHGPPRLARGPEDYTAYVVWLDWEEERRRRPDVDYDQPHYMISVQASADVDPDHFDGPDTEDLGVALDWARAHASRILVRPAWDPSRHYLVGDGPASEWPVVNG